jgi:phosphohistidine phosphatase
MELLILRHAIAFPRDASRWPDDATRPITPEGVRKARHAARGLKRLVTPPALVLTSPLIRARDTAKIYAQEARWPEAVECEALSPARDPMELLTQLRRHDGKAVRVGIVGHQPHLGRLLALCLWGEARPDAFEIRKSAIAHLKFDGPPRAGRGVLIALLPPRALRKI